MDAVYNKLSGLSTEKINALIGAALKVVSDREKIASKLASVVGLKLNGVSRTYKGRSMKWENAEVVRLQKPSLFRKDEPMPLAVVKTDQGERMIRLSTFEPKRKTAAYQIIMQAANAMAA